MFDRFSALTSLHVEVACIQIPINSKKSYLLAVTKNIHNLNNGSRSMLPKSPAQFSAGAIYVREHGSFTQLGGTLTIADAAAESDGGMVRIRKNPRHGKNAPFL